MRYFIHTVSDFVLAQELRQHTLTLISASSISGHQRALRPPPHPLLKRHFSLLAQVAMCTVLHTVG